ncbi:hypothetical protein VPHK479_0090 [Vibrio phage K479]
MELINPDVRCIYAATLTDLTDLLRVTGKVTMSAFPTPDVELPAGCDGWHFIVTGLVHATPDIKVYMNQVINTRVIHADLTVHPKCKIEVI